MNLREIFYYKAIAFFRSREFALCRAAADGRTKAVRYFLSSGISPNALGGKPLICAASHGKTDAAKMLIDHGADIHAADEHALLAASAAGHEAVVELLLNAGADVGAKNGLALRHAVANGHVGIVRLLLPVSPVNRERSEELVRLAERNNQTQVAAAILSSTTAAGPTEIGHRPTPP